MATRKDKTVNNKNTRLFPKTKNGPSCIVMNAFKFWTNSLSVVYSLLPNSSNLTKQIEINKVAVETRKLDYYFQKTCYMEEIWKIFLNLQVGLQ